MTIMSAREATHIDITAGLLLITSQGSKPLSQLSGRTARDHPSLKSQLHWSHVMTVVSSHHQDAPASTQF